MKTSKISISSGTAFAGVTILSLVVILGALFSFSVESVVAPSKTESATATTGGSLSVKDWQLIAK